MHVIRCDYYSRENMTDMHYIKHIDPCCYMTKINHVAFSIISDT